MNISKCTLFSSGSFRYVRLISTVSASALKRKNPQIKRMKHRCHDEYPHAVFEMPKPSLQVSQHNQFCVESPNANPYRTASVPQQANTPAKASGRMELKACMRRVLVICGSHGTASSQSRISDPTDTNSVTGRLSSDVSTQLGTQSDIYQRCSVADQKSHYLIVSVPAYNRKTQF